MSYFISNAGNTDVVFVVFEYGGVFYRWRPRGPMCGGTKCKLPSHTKIWRRLGVGTFGIFTSYIMVIFAILM